MLNRPTQIISLDKREDNSARFIWDQVKVILAVRPDVGGNPELVADGETGFLVDPHKPGGMIVVAFGGR